MDGQLKVLKLVKRYAKRGANGRPDYTRLHTALLEEAQDMARKTGWAPVRFDGKEIGGSKEAWLAWLHDDPWQAALPNHPVFFLQVARLERVIVTLSFVKEVAHATTD